MISYWQRGSFPLSYDLAVIGAGIVGLHAALFHKRKYPMQRVCVIERGTYPNGASIRNAGFACFGSPSEILHDIRTEGQSRAIARVEKRWEGLSGLRSELGDRNIVLIDHGGYELFGGDTDLYTACEEKIDELNELLLPIIGSKVYEPADDIIQAMGFSGLNHAIRINGEASIDTGKMMRSLWNKVGSAGVEILGNTRITHLDTTNSAVRMDSAAGNKIRAEQVIVATNGYTRELGLDLPVVPGRGQVIMTSSISELKVIGNHHLEEGYYYFRPVGDRILLGGGRNLDKQAEETTEEGLTELVQAKLESLLHEVILPGHSFEIEQRWSGIMGFGPTKEPIVERLNERVIVAARSGGMGIAIGHTLGKRAAEIAST